MFLSVDGTFWIQILNFLVFLWILNVVFLKPVGAAIAKRRAYIDGVIGDYDKAVAETQSLEHQAEQKRAAARREADEIVAKARASASDEAAALAAQSNTQAQQIVEAAQATVANEMTAARAQEDELARGLAAQMMDRAVGGLR